MESLQGKTPIGQQQQIAGKRGMEAPALPDLERCEVIGILRQIHAYSPFFPMPFKSIFFPSETVRQHMVYGPASQQL